MTSSHVDGPTRSYVDGDGWVCVFCTYRNELSAVACAHCHLSFDGGRLSEQTASTRSSRARLVDALTVTRSASVEVSVVVTLFLLYRLGDVLTAGDRTAAVAHGRTLWRLERDLRLPSEASLQRLVIHHQLGLDFLDTYYVAGHLGGLAVAGIWLFRRRRQAFATWRTVIGGATAICLLLQLIAVAPPRLVPGLGLVDVAARQHESVYSHGGVANQLSAFPSVHMAWAVLVAAMVVSVGTTRRRLLVIAHPAVTLFVIVATANHYWLDAVVASLIAGAVMALVRRLRATV